MDIKVEGVTKSELLELNTFRLDTWNVPRSSAKLAEFVTSKWASLGSAEEDQM